MADKIPSLQDNFLNECRRKRSPVTIFLMKGVKLSGFITWFDAFSLLLHRDGVAQLIYKHSISTIMPSEPIELTASARAELRGRPALQDIFLGAAEREAAMMTLFLVNGVMLQGAVVDHDQFVLLLARAGQAQMVYKHAISTLQPAHLLDLGGQAGDDS